MAMKKQKVAGGFVGVLCIAAIVLAIVFGIMWGQCKDDKKKVMGRSCGENNCLNIDACKNDYSEGLNQGCVDSCTKYPDTVTCTTTPTVCTNGTTSVPATWSSAVDAATLISAKKIQTDRCHSNLYCNMNTEDDAIRACYDSATGKPGNLGIPKIVDMCSNSESFRKCIAGPTQQTAQYCNNHLSNY
jgi:hypothetical protein